MSGNRKQLLKIAVRDNWICWLCGQAVDPEGVRGRRPTRDHVVPRSQGGRNGTANLRLAHDSCNRKRAERMQALDREDNERD